MIRRAVLAALVAAGPAAALPGTLAAQAIDTIVVENHNIFEPLGDAPGLLARLGDALHVRTRAWVIRRTLLFDRPELAAAADRAGIAIVGRPR